MSRCNRTADKIYTKCQNDPKMVMSPLPGDLINVPKVVHDTCEMYESLIYEKS